MTHNPTKFPFKGIVVYSVSVNLHTDAIFQQLANYLEVYLFTQREEFREHGKLNLGKVNVVNINGLNSIPHHYNHLLSKDYLHISGAIKRFRNFNDEAYKCFRNAIELQLPTMALNIEQYPWWGLKGFIRSLQWRFILKFSKMRTLKAIGCQGNSGVVAFQKAGITRNKLFEYIYCSPNVISNIASEETNNQYTFTYIGKITERKNIIPAVKVLKSTDYDFCMYIIGKGNQENELHGIIGDDQRFKVLGALPIPDVQTYLELTDCLILPSNFDGWGAVVSEAITHGCRCIVSDHAGSHSIIAESAYGSVFKSNDWHDFHKAISSEFNKGKLSAIEKQNIKNFGLKIAPQSTAEYLLKIIEYYFGNSSTEKPIAPWKN